MTTGSAHTGDFFDELEAQSPSQRVAYLNRRLVEAVEHAYRNAPAAREIMDGAGVKPAQIGIVKDLEKLPIIRKTDLIERQKRHPPYGGVRAIPPAQVERVFSPPRPICEPLQHSGIKCFAQA